jgi:YVTN family beta-propeller protein
VNELSGSVTPINTATNTAGTPVGVGGAPVGVAITADGKTAYVANQGSANVTPIDTATNTAGTTIAVGTDPNELAITPDQGPVAAFSASPAPAGTATALNAFASTSPAYPIATYAWRFGDGATATSSTPTATHVYAKPGIYTVTLTAIDQAGCATALVYNGQTALCNESSKAISAQTITVPAAKSVPISSLPPAPLGAPARPALSELSVSPLRASLAGRKVNGKCVKPTNTNAGKPRCKRSIQLKISYRLSAPDAVTSTLKLKTAGRDVKGKCLKSSNHNKKHPSCARLVAMPGSITQTSKAGANAFTLIGKFAGHALGAGTYVLTVTPAGGKAQQVSFTIRA